MDAYSLTFYGSAPKNDTKFIDGLLGFSNLKTDIFNKNGYHELRGKREGKQIFGAINFLSTFKKNRFNLNPTGKINLGYTQLDSYREMRRRARELEAIQLNSIQDRIGTGSSFLQLAARFAGWNPVHWIRQRKRLLGGTVGFALR